MATVTARSHQHETLDAMCHRLTGTSGGTVEATLDATPGLAKIAADMPAGQQVRIQQQAKRTQQPVQLWD